MTIDLTRVGRLADVVSDRRRKITGESLRPPPIDRWPTDIESYGQFSELVTSMYRWLHEDWGHEIAFVLTLAESVGAASKELRVLQGLVIDLRTSQQHTSNGDPSTRRASKWYMDVVGKSFPSVSTEWETCGSALVKACVAGLGNLVGIANKVASDTRTSTAWAERTRLAHLQDPTIQVSIVVSDLGLDPPPGVKQYLERAVDHDWARRLRSLTPGDDPAKELANVAEKVVVGWSLGSLPCPYTDILDAMEVDPGRTALGALQLAHAMSEIFDFDTLEEFLDLLSRVWRLVTGE